MLMGSLRQNGYIKTQIDRAFSKQLRRSDGNHVGQLQISMEDENQFGVKSLFHKSVTFIFYKILLLLSLPLVFVAHDLLDNFLKIPNLHHTCSLLNFKTLL